MSDVMLCCDFCGQLREESKVYCAVLRTGSRIYTAEDGNGGHGRTFVRMCEDCQPRIPSQD